MQNIINNSTSKFDLLQLSGYMKTKTNKFKFNLLNSDKLIPADEIYRIIDPSNDQAFKSLFIGTTKINNLNGLDRAKSLIESILYKFNNKYLIKNCEYIPNEIPEVSGKNRNKIRVVDCPIICEMTDNSKYIIDLEIQNYYYNGVDLNMFDHAASLRNSYDSFPVIVIVLLLKDTYHDVSSFEMKAYKKPFNETNFEIVDDFIWVLFLDLYYIVDCLNEDREPNLGGLELSHIGKEWIKLLTVKHWMESGPIGGENDDRYPIPKNLSNSKEIISALMILNSTNNSFITKLVLKEKERQKIIEDSNNTLLINLWIDSFLKGKTIDPSIVPFPIISARYLIEECRKKLNENNCSQFVKMLIDNQIIINKQIYEKLINDIYR